MAKISISKRTANEIDRYIGERVRAARRATDISQEALGAKLGVTFQQIQKYENGSNRISCGALALIANTVGQSVEWFFEGAPGLGHESVVAGRMSKFFATTGAAKLAADFVRLDPRAQTAVRQLAESL